MVDFSIRHVNFLGGRELKDQVTIFQSQTLGVESTPHAKPTDPSRTLTPPPAQAARPAWHVAALGFPSAPCRTGKVVQTDEDGSGQIVIFHQPGFS